MKKLIVVALSFLMFACSEEKGDNFSKFEWIAHYGYYDKDYNFTTHQKVLFKNDSIVCFSELTGKKTMFPLIKKDSLIIFNQLYTIEKKGDKKKDTVITDTLLYDFKNLFNKPLLIVKSLNSKFYSVLTTSNNSNLVMEETNNFLSIINFEIGGLQIGDSISIKDFDNVKDKKTYDDTNLVLGNPKGNENIEVQIINKKYVYSIKQKNIKKNQTENIIKVINEKMKIAPDTIKKSKPFYREGFRWESNGIDIRLSKIDMYQYYKDNSEDKKQPYYMIDAYKRRLIKEVGKTKYYELEYKNEFLQTILRTIGNKTAQSSIIE